jgi:hypothetical protein
MRLSKNQKNVLKIISKSLVLASSILAPNIVQILRPKNAKEKYKHSRTVKKLFDDEIIYLFGEEIRLTKKGKELLGVIPIEDIQIFPKDDWNGVWHIVCYDVPEAKKTARDYFRAKLAEVGFKFIQDSMWVYPYECKEEIAIIAQNLGIAPFVAYLNTDYLPQQERLVRHFNLEK